MRRLDSHISQRTASEDSEPADEDEPADDHQHILYRHARHGAGFPLQQSMQQAGKKPVPAISGQEESRPLSVGTGVDLCA